MSKFSLKLLIYLAVATLFVAIPMSLSQLVFFGTFDGFWVIFYLLYPMLSITTGTIAGRQARELWFFPVVPPLVIFSFWAVYSGGFEVPGWGFLGCYLGFGVVALLISAGVCWLVRRHRAKEAAPTKQPSRRDKHPAK